MALKAKDLNPQDLTKITVDTTVQEKVITFPTDAKLHYKAIERLRDSAKENGIDLPVWPRKRWLWFSEIVTTLIAKA